MTKICHELGPIYNKDSEILILRSLPSAKSREVKFYYAHEPNDTTIEEKKRIYNKT